MLRRTFYMNKRKEKKAEIDKTQQMIKMIIEKKLAELKKKTPGEQMAPNQMLQLDSVEILNNFQQDVREYILIANKYLSYKNSEEQAKVSHAYCTSILTLFDQTKRAKKDMSASKQFEQLEYETEMERIIQELTAGVPENLQLRLENGQLRSIFGLPMRAGLMPKAGVLFNQI